MLHVAQLLIFTAVALAQATRAPLPRAATPAQPPCVRAGCNGELCVPRNDLGDVASICVALPDGEAACYKAAVCAPTSIRSGCAWQDQDALDACIAKARAAKKRS